MSALPAIGSSLGLSIVLGVTTASLVKRVGPSFVAKGLKGVDMLKGYPSGSTHLAMSVAARARRSRVRQT